MQLDQVLEALSDPTRRDIFERVVARPTRIRDLAEALPVSRSAVSYHAGILRAADLVQDGEDGRLHPNPDVLPRLRMYFDRLWLEAALGDGWLLRRRQDISDFGL